MEWTIAIGLAVLHLALCAVVVAIAWHGPLARQVKLQDQRKSKKNEKK
jgi:hypothetical protein